MTAEHAVSSIRHVVQEHGDEHTKLGVSGSAEGIKWVGNLLGWSWPPSYLEVIEKHDGVMVGDVVLFSFLESFDCLMRLHDQWHGVNGFWPVGSDGCGNFYAFAAGPVSGEPPVVFLDMIESSMRPVASLGDNYAAWVVERMNLECTRAKCAWVFR
jgi:hypothetical protein